jgi:hypothetical protein
MGIVKLLQPNGDNIIKILVVNADMPKFVWVAAVGNVCGPTRT